MGRIATAVRARGAVRAPVVLVVDAGFRSGPWACRSLARAGFRVVGGHEDGGRFAGRSRYCPRPYRYPSLRSDPDGFLEAIERLCRSESVAAVLPLSESALHLLVERLPAPADAVLVGPDAAQYDALCNKVGLERTAAAASVESPRGVVVDANGAQGTWPPLPSIVKPLASATPTETGVVYRRAAIVSSAPAREDAVREIVAGTGAALVQEFVAGAGWIVDFVRDAGRLLAVTRLVVRSYPKDTGSATVARTVPAPPGLLAAARRLLDRVDYRGPGSIDFLERERRFLAHDVNLRLPFSVGGAIAAGLDMPALAVHERLGHPLPRAVRSGRRRTYVWLGGEARALVDGLRGRETAASVGRIATGLVLAAVAPGRVLDQLSPLDPLATVASATSGLKKVAGRTS